jgi:outer membrane protein assembly factor BamB
VKFRPVIGAAAAVACLTLAGMAAAGNAGTLPANVVFGKVLFDFADGSYLWGNLTVANPSAPNATWNATLAAAQALRVYIAWSWSCFAPNMCAVFVNDVGNRSPPNYVVLYVWNGTSHRWDAATVGISNVTMTSGGAIALSDGGYESGPPYAPISPVPTVDNPNPAIQFRGGARNLGVASGPAPAGVSLAWDRNLGVPQIEASPAVAYGRVFVLTQNGIWALNASTGAIVWSNSAVRGLSSPAVWDGNLIFGGKDGIVHCLNATTGADVWSRTLLAGPTISGITSSPKVVFDTVYIGTFNETGGAGAVVALWAMNGTIRWRYTNATLGSVDFSSPAIVNGTVYVGVMGRYNTTTSVTFDPPYGVLALNASTGSRRWFYSTAGSVAASVVVSGNVVYAPAKDGFVYAIDATRGTLRWAAMAQGGVSSPAYDEGVLYVGGGAYGNSGSIKALRVSDGSSLWSFAPNGPVQASVSYADGLVLGATNTAQGTIYALDAVRGTVAWTFTPTPADYMFASPVLADGVVFATSDSGHVFALEAATQPLLNLTSTSAPSVYANETTTVTLTITAQFGAARAVQVALFLDGLTFVNSTWPGVSQPRFSESWNLSLVPFRASLVNRIVLRGNCIPPPSAQASTAACSSFNAKATVIVQSTNVQGTPQPPLTDVITISVLTQPAGFDWLAFGLGAAAGAAIVAAAVFLMFRRGKRKVGESADASK